MRTPKRFFVGDTVRITCTGSSISAAIKETGKWHYGAEVNSIVKITGISVFGGSANFNDPRYYGENFNCRAEGLELVQSRAYEIF